MLKAALKASAAAVLVMGMSCVSYAGDVLNRVVTNKVLVNAVEGEFPPFNSIGPNNEIVGFDIDVAKVVAKRLGVELQTVTRGWDVITAGKWANRWDIAISSMANTKARQEILDFPTVYYYMPAVIVVHKDNASIKSVSDLSKKNVGVQVATTNEKYLQKNLQLGDKPLTFDFDDVKIVSFETEALLIDDLALGDGVRLDAVSVGSLTAHEHIKSGKPLKIVGDPLFYEEASVAIDKGDPEFGAKIASIIEELRADGTLKRLAEQRFGFDITVPPSK